MKQKLSKLGLLLKKVPDRKHYIEFITAILSIPVLLTVILVNMNNLSAQNKKTASSSPTPVKEVIIHETVKDTPLKAPQISPTSSACKKEIGPISISYPAEGAIVSDNPVNFIIRYEDKNYCAVVWSYRINNSSWSEYSSNSPSVYNIPNGTVRFELRIQSTVSSDQAMFQRTFTYQNSASPTPTPSLTQTPTPTQ